MVQTKINDNKKVIVFKRICEDFLLCILNKKKKIFFPFIILRCINVAFSLDDIS